MSEKNLSELTNEELLEEAKRNKPKPIFTATFIGILIGIIIYSIVQNTWGLVTLVPLFLIYQLLKRSKRNDELEKLMEERKLKL
ncbi:FUSC family protein [Salegentibacter sp. LM13S]|uniref:FUSC family protein n=1 Tax=Salegentibacter lacus TaxID=2873599 RepID=UPI001CCA4A43|nr:FUSC family protein [Salegentibacter lacus]MBZ9632667.1 FUSC family protein [Salegentibacter lacus]